MLFRSTGRKGPSEQRKAHVRALWPLRSCSGQVQFDVLVSCLERLVEEENTEGTEEWSGEQEEMSRVYFLEAKRKVYSRKREGRGMDSAVWYGKGSRDIGCLRESSLGVDGWRGSRHAREQLYQGGTW